MVEKYRIPRTYLNPHGATIFIFTPEEAKIFEGFVQEEYNPDLPLTLPIKPGSRGLRALRFPNAQETLPYRRAVEEVCQKARLGIQTIK